MRPFLTPKVAFAGITEHVISKTQPLDTENLTNQKIGKNTKNLKSRRFVRMVEISAKENE